MCEGGTDQFFPMIHTNGSREPHVVCEPQFGPVCSREYIENSLYHLSSKGSLRTFILSNVTSYEWRPNFKVRCEFNLHSRKIASS
jgi:hypothetical protein